MKIDHSRRLNNSALCMASVGAGPVSLNVQKLPCGLQQRLRLDFTGDAVVWTYANRPGLHWTFTDLDGERFAGPPGLDDCPTFIHGAAFKIWLATVTKCVRIPGDKWRALARLHETKNGGICPAVSVSS